jgi:hypothetical protein
MALSTRARFDDVPIWRQLAQEYETAALELACFRGDVVPAARTEASVVDCAWGAADARYPTEDDVKAYARKMLEEAQRFYDDVHGGPRIVICVEDASDPQTRVYCRMNMCDKLHAAIEAYKQVKQLPAIMEIQYGGVPFADNRVYPWNTPHALAMEEHDVIRVFSYGFEPGLQVDYKHIKRLDICILGAEGLVEETFKHYTCWINETLDKYAVDFCTRKGLDMSKVRFMNAGKELNVQGRYCVSKFLRPVCKPEAGPVLIYVLPNPEFESHPDLCYVRDASLSEEEHAAGGAGATATRVHRRRRPTIKMDL